MQENKISTKEIKKQLPKKIAEAIGVTESTFSITGTDVVIDCFLKLVSEAIASGKKVYLKDIGNFYTKTMTSNLKDMEYQKVIFKSSDKLKKGLKK